MVEVVEVVPPPAGEVGSAVTVAAEEVRYIHGDEQSSNFFALMALGRPLRSEATTALIAMCLSIFKRMQLSLFLPVFNALQLIATIALYSCADMIS